MGGIKEFSTAGMSAASSLAAWREYMAEVYYKLDIVSVGENVRGSLSESSVASICVSSFKADAQRVIRRKQAAKMDGAENFVFLFPLREALVCRQRNNEGRIEPGDVVVLNSAEHYEVDVPDGSENVTLKIPCADLRDRLSWIDDCCSRPNIANKQIVPILSTMATQFLSIQQEVQTSRLQDICLDLIELMAETSARSYRGQSYATCLGDHLFDTVKTFLRRNLSKPHLGIEDAAKEAKVSERYIQKVFQDHRTTFGKELMEMRLMEADRLLRSPANRTRLQIGQIAFLTGFANQAHFSVRYHQRFGLAPREAGRS